MSPGGPNGSGNLERGGVERTSPLHPQRPWKVVKPMTRNWTGGISSITCSTFRMSSTVPPQWGHSSKGTVTVSVTSGAWRQLPSWLGLRPGRFGFDWRLRSLIRNGAAGRGGWFRRLSSSRLSEAGSTSKREIRPGLAQDDPDQFVGTVPQGFEGAAQLAGIVAHACTHRQPEENLETLNTY